jgi:dihydroorotate dehydrogenase (NAD+) catalytic subunit
MLNVNICGVDFKNPVLAASGTFGFGREFSNFYDVSMVGGICSKGLTLNKKDGNAGIRIWETRSGILNSVGLQNPGVRNFIEDELPFMETLNTVLIANLGGADTEEYIEGIKLLSETSVDFIELNISCPNVKHGCLAYGTKSKDAYELVKMVKDVCKKPLIVKLSPNAENITDMAVSVEKAGADAVSLINTLKGMAIDIGKRKAVFENITAGFSGPAIKPVALRMVYEVSKSVQIPVIGVGGIMNSSDALEFIMAGASAIEVGTANMVDPYACLNIIKGMESFMMHENIKSLNEIRGII